MSGDRLVVFIHGLGEGPEVWDAQVRALPPGFIALAVNAFGAEVDEGFSIGRSAREIALEMDRLGVASAHICGLSLGAMVALQIAVDYPARVLTLRLAAGQVRPPKALLRVQRAIMALLPKTFFAHRGADKPQMLAVLKSVERIDFSNELASVVAPTLVLCGSKDRANLPAARALAAGIPNAELRVLAGAGHQSHLDAPGAFASALGAVLQKSD
jgi:pimeloyl-ACP methyl ester carboxylesterase